MRVVERRWIGLCCLAALLAVPAAGQEEPAGKKSDGGKPAKPAKTKKIELEGLSLAVPEDWKREKPANRLRLAQFQIPQAEGDKVATEMVVYNFGGSAGGVDANIRRWINQFTGAGRTVEVVKGTAPQGTYYLVDIQGTYKRPVGPPIRRQTEEMPDARMLAVIMPIEEKGNFFLKMAGPEKSVSAQVKALRASIGGKKESEKPYELKQ